MRAEISTLACSLFINFAVLYALDRTVSVEEFRSHLEQQRQQAVIAKRPGDIQFEYVEAPRKTYPQSPKRGTKKISSRDALNQDLLKDKSNAQELPFVKTQGVADQLRQVRGVAGASPSPPTRPQQAQAQKEASKQNQAPEKENVSKLGEKAKKTGTETDIFKPVPKTSSQTQASQAVPPKAASPAQNAAAGLPGQDKISTQELSKSKSHGAQLYGTTSFEATGSGMGEYMKNLKEKIWLNWFPYLSFQYPKDFKTADAVLSITLNEKGDVKIVRIVESEGSPLFASLCAESIQRASNFGPLPKEILTLLGKDELEIKFGFHYK